MTETKTRVYMLRLNTVTKIGTEMTGIETKDGIVIEIDVKIMIEVSCWVCVKLKLFLVSVEFC